MPKRRNIVRATAEDARRMLESGGDRTDWQRVKDMTQAEVERLADQEDGKLPEGWESTIVLGMPEPK